MKPRVAVTLGDPAGVGPEVVARALLHPLVRAACEPVVYGTFEVLEAALRLVGGGDAAPPYGVVPIPGPRPGGFEPGRVSAACGQVSLDCLDAAARDVLAGRADALATAPLNKSATALAGCREAGHLEYLMRLAGVPADGAGTVLVAGRLRCLHLTTHRSLAAAVAAVTRDLILARLRLAQREMARFGCPAPRIAVAALNPHGGEGGLFGREELESIAPAVQAARSEGIDAHGPFPADSLLPAAAGSLLAAAAGTAADAGGWDLVLVMYHDQGHIAVKVHDFQRSYAVAFGLPLVRTSVDHGTAFDLAWQGKADARSMVAAIIAAASLAQGRWPDPASLGG